MKTYKKILLLILLNGFLFIHSNSYSQLSGSYTIGSGGSYTTITAAANALVTNGINGPVMFNIISGSYDESVTIDSVAGAGSVNTITFRSQSGNAGDVTLFTSSSAIFFIKLNKTDFITFSDLTFNDFNSISTQRSRIFLQGNCDNVKFTGNVFKGGINGAGISGAGVSLSNFIVDSNNFNIKSGIYIFDPTVKCSNTLILNNSFNCQFGISIYKIDGLILQKNNINCTSPVNPHGYSTYFSDCRGNISITKNKLVSTSPNDRSTDGLQIVGYSGSNLLIANNFISIDIGVGMYIQNCQNIKIYYNTIQCNARSSADVYITGSPLAAFRNNIFVQYVNLGNNLVCDYGNNLINSDYNDFYYHSIFMANYYGVGYITSLLQFQTLTGQDMNSTETPVNFVSSFDLHLAGSSIGDKKLLGTPVPEVTDDIDGNPRNPYLPYMGADEGDISFTQDSHFRYGHLTYYKNPFNNSDVTFTLTNAFRRNSFGSPNVGDEVIENAGNTKLFFGDGSSTPVLHYRVISVDSVNNYFVGRALNPSDTSKQFINHLYAEPGPFQAEIYSGSRLSLQVNNYNRNYRVSTIIDVSNGNNSPVCSLPVVVNIEQGISSSFNVPVSDNDPDTFLKFRFATRSEMGNVFQSPPKAGPYPATIDPFTGMVTWNSTAAVTGGLYSCQVIIEDRSKTDTSLIKARVAVDFLISVNQQCTSNKYPEFISPSICGSGFIGVTVGQPLILTITAADPDSGDIRLEAAGLPPTAVMTPVLPAIGKNVTSVFYWVPSIYDFQSYYNITFIATNGCGLQTSCNVNIDYVVDHCNSSSDPEFASPTPVSGTVISQPANTLFRFKLEGTHSDPGRVYLVASNVPVGAVLYPILPVFGKPAGSDFNWIPDISQIGMHKVKFTIIDTCGFFTDCFIYLDVQSPPAIVDLSMLIEGFYDPDINMQTGDTIRSFLRASVTPYNIADSSESFLLSDGRSTLHFSNASNGNYFLVLKHRNSIETWSKTSDYFIRGETTHFDFTNSVSGAYGNNLVRKGNEYCIYSGDVNQDGLIDLTDLILILNNSVIFLTGYVSTDVNGDNITDLADLLITYNNSVKFIEVIKP